MSALTGTMGATQLSGTTGAVPLAGEAEAVALVATVGAVPLRAVTLGSLALAGVVDGFVGAAQSIWSLDFSQAHNSGYLAL